MMLHEINTRNNEKANMRIELSTKPTSLYKIRIILNLNSRITAI